MGIRIYCFVVLFCICSNSEAMRWPDENYALPMSVYGCPDNAFNDWKYGYINMTFNSTLTFFEHPRGRLGRNETDLSLTELLGPYGPHSIQLNFCGREKKESSDEVFDWPSGQYGVYGTKPNQSCPIGFTGSYINLTLPYILFYNQDGFLPDMKITHNVNGSRPVSILRFRKCQRNDFGEAQQFRTDELDMSTILLTHDAMNTKYISSSEWKTSKLSRYNASDNVEPKQLYLTVPHGGTGIESRTRYDLISYFTITPHEQSLNIEAPDYLGLDGFTSEDTWVLYDIGIGAVINGLALLGGYSGLTYQQRFGVTPQIYVSEMKWSFLNNGARRCITDVYTSYSFGTATLDWILIKCLNNPVGRYVSLVFSNELNRMDLKSLFPSIQLVQFITKEKSPRCSRPLGMTSGAILDAQLLASSSKVHSTTPERARPGQMGWCADYNDRTPYYQIDFVASMRIEAVEFHKVQLVNSYSSGSGVLVTFGVEYGFNGSDLQTFSKNFTLQMKSANDMHVQTITFTSTLRTRYLRLYPKQLDSTMSTICMEFEVIGCEIPDPFQRHCDAKGTSQWFRVNNLPIPHRHNYPVLALNTTEGCQSACDILPQCYGVSVNPINDTMLCEMFLQSSTYSYREQSYHNYTGEAFVKLCDTEEYFEASSGYLSAFNDLHWGDKTRKDPSVLVSPGYPLYYPAGAVLLWSVHAEEGQYVNLLFSNLSLSKSKSDYSSRGCEETIYLYPYPINTTEHLSRITKHIEYGTFESHPHDSLPMVLTGDMNKQQVVYSSETDSITIVFRACQHERINHGDVGHGFRLLGYSSDQPTCLRWGFRTSDQEIGCFAPSAQVSSMTFAGFFSFYFEKSEFNAWTIIVDRTAYISLVIKDFDVGCETGTVFAVTNVGTTTRYCNLNRPVYPIVSDSNRLSVKFHARLCGSTELVEGFKASYTSAVKKEYVTDLTMVEEYGNKTFAHPSFKVCSDSFNKCYEMLDLHKLANKTLNVTAVGWNYTSKFICGKHGWHLVNIHSQKEQDFVVYYLQHKIQTYKRHILNSTGYFGYTYVGLHRRFGKFIWSDGSPVTYTSWKPGHPSRYSQSACSRMNIRSASADSQWESVSCGNQMADYAVCEYPFRFLTSDSGSEEADMDKSTPIKNDLEMAVYFDCGDGEITSMLARCDGHQDCVSGADETGCNIDTNSTECSLEQFRCNDGRCLDISLLCDFHDDCDGGEDEDCDFVDCLANEFRCQTNECIGSHLVCDGKPDCRQGEDEHSCSACNSSTSFSCGDYTCIPLSYKCDGVPDCQTELDEKNCDEILPQTCQEWYDAGYRENGIYKIYGVDMECNFDEIDTTGRIIIKYHSIDYLTAERKREIGDLYLEYGSDEALKTLVAPYECFQSVDQECQPWIQELYEVDGHGTGGQNRRCECLRWTLRVGTGERHYDSCDGLNTTRQPLMTIGTTHGIPYITSAKVKINYLSYTSGDFADIRLRINPVVCYAVFRGPKPDIVCGNGITAPLETKCLYDETEYGTVKGCRNLAHLQNCESFECPAGFFKCPSSFCLENRFVCDGVKHCEHGDDELSCGESTQICFNQYRCLHTNVCLSFDYLCDGFRQCLMGDDERFCNFRCPSGCSCQGLAINCRAATTGNETSLPQNVRLIDTSSNSEFLNLISLKSNNLIYLSFLNMSFCNISEIQSEFFGSMKNLLVLDVSYNNLEILKSDTFHAQKKLNHLFLAGNSDIHTIEPRAFAGLESLKVFEMKYVHVKHLSRNAFQSLEVITMDLSNNYFDRVDDEIFKNVKADNLFLNSTKVKKFGDGMFHGMQLKSTLITDAYKFCCIKPKELPEEKCYPQKNEFSSCSDLMRNDALRALLWVIGLFSLLGNGASLIYRFLYDRERLKMGYGIFVSNLAIADFLMGVYLVIIASADVAFRGTYIYRDESWRFSGWCKLAGILSTVSSEASVLFICLITLDRILVIKYPFGQVRFTTTSAVVSSGIVWVVVSIVGILPVAITSYFKDSFYSKSGVCLALPLTRDRPPGWVYSISIFIGFNCITFLAIAFGQWMIYTTINKARSKMKSFSTARSNDLRVARNLLFVASTDFLCWFPIGILGILALTGHVIPGEVYAWTAVLVLPINSALNPFLYTLSAILGRAKFQPDASEQTRTQVTSIDVIERHYDVWNSKLFVQPSLTKCMMSLAQHLKTKQKEVGVNRCLFVAVIVARCIEFLHDRDVSTENLSLENIYLRPSKGSFSVVMSFKPKMVQKDSEKQEDINKYGKLLDSILKQCKASAIKSV